MLSKSIRLFMLLFVSLYILVGCSAEPAVIEVERIELSDDHEKIEAGDVYHLDAEIFPENANDKSLTWISSNENIATVKEGNVYGITDGDAYITAKSTNGVESKAFQINVRTPTAEDNLNDEENSIYRALTLYDVVYEYFKEPSSVSVRKAQQVVRTDEDGKDVILALTYIMEISADNGFGGKTVDTYYVDCHQIRLTNEKITTPVEGADMSKINKALQAYYEEKGY